jgi:hypothetical protein
MKSARAVGCIFLSTRAREKSGFFNFPKAENVSAVIVNPQGTLPKFNRLGYLAEFGNRRVRMTREGTAQAGPRAFVRNVHEPGYDESWVEGMVVFHNPNALIELPPEMLPGASHEFLAADGSITSLVPDFHPLFSRTAIWVADDKEP